MRCATGSAAPIEAARRLDGAGGAYLNFSGDEATDERVVEQQFGGNLDRLRAIKKQYDPDNLFRINNNIKPYGATRSVRA